MIPLESVAVSTAFGAKAPIGVNVAVTPEYDTVPGTGVVPCFTVNVAVLTVWAFSGLLKVAASALVIGTFVAPLTGTVETTVGGVMSGVAPVVKLHTYGATMAFPERSMIPVDIVAVSTAFGANVPIGVNVAVTPAYVTVPETGVAPCCTLKVAALTVRGFSGLLKVAANALVIETFVAPLAGTVELTVGGVVSAVAPVVKLHT
jgi:hypothetical protein